MGYSLFSKNIIGLDISDHSIEVVESSTKIANPIIKKARKELPPGIVERGRIKDQEGLTKHIRLAFEEGKIRDLRRKKLVFGLPESQTFIRIFDAKGKKEEDIDGEAKNELYSNIPLDRDSAVYEFFKLDNRSRAAVVAAERSVLMEWKKFLDSLGFAEVSIAVETFASYVGLGVKKEMMPAAVVDIGSASTMVSVYDDQDICFSSSANIAGEFLTKKIAEASGLSEEEAEKEKCQNGLGNTNEKIQTALKQGLDEIISNIKKILQYCKDSRGKEAANIILIGGTSQMPGIVDYCKTQKGLNVSIGISHHLSEKINLLYIGAVGLALYERDKRNFPIFDCSLPQDKKKATVKEEEEDQEETDISNEPEENFEEEYAEDKIKKQKIILAIIIIAGIAVVSVAFWYSSEEDKKNKAKIAAQTQNFLFASSFDLSVPVAVDPAEQTNDRAAGRIFEDKIQILGAQNEAVQTSFSTAKKQLLEEEVLWETPLTVISAPAENSAAVGVADYTIRWIIYNESSVNSLFTGLAEEQMKSKGVKYSISNIEKKSIDKTENENIYMIFGMVSVATDKQIEVPSEQDAADTSSGSIPVEDKTKGADSTSTTTDTTAREVTVQETGTGWLKVRKAPDAAAEIITKIYPGEKYEVLDQEGDWLQLQLKDGQTGWAALRYLRQ